MSFMMDLARRARRNLGYARQIVADYSWHRRFEGPEMPPLRRRMAEQARLLYISGIDGEDYYHHGLFRPDMPFSDKEKFLGYFQKTRYYDTINPHRFDILARDKVLFHILAKSLELPVPELLAVTLSGSEPGYGLILSDRAALEAFLQRDGAEDLFLKPGGGSLGEGALSLGSRIPGREAWTKLPGDSSIDLESVLDHVHGKGQMQRFLIQKRLRPHPVLGEIVPDVCSTVRVMTFIQDGHFTLMGAALRLGSGRDPTDNLSGGGVVASVDLESGLLGDVTNLDAGVPRRMSAHPVTGVPISGKVIPGWAEVAELVEAAAFKLSFLPCIGWDIAITDKGAVIVEINTGPRCRPLQVAQDSGVLRGPFREALLRHNGTLNSGLHIRSD